MLGAFFGFILNYPDRPAPNSIDAALPVVRAQDRRSCARNLSENCIVRKIYSYEYFR